MRLITYKIRICPECGEAAPSGYFSSSPTCHTNKEYLEIEVTPKEDPHLSPQSNRARKFYRGFQKNPVSLVFSKETIEKLALIAQYHPHHKEWGKKQLEFLFQDIVRREAKAFAENLLQKNRDLLSQDDIPELTNCCAEYAKSAVLNAGFLKKNPDIEACIEKAKQEIPRYAKDAKGPIYDRWELWREE